MNTPQHQGDRCGKILSKALRQTVDPDKVSRQMQPRDRSDLGRAGRYGRRASAMLMLRRDRATGTRGCRHGAARASCEAGRTFLGTAFRWTLSATRRRGPCRPTGPGKVGARTFRGHSVRSRDWDDSLRYKACKGPRSVGSRGRRGRCLCPRPYMIVGVYRVTFRRSSRAVPGRRPTSRGDF